MPNLIINGFGYRRTGTVNRPQIEMITPVDTTVEALSVITTLVVHEDLFETSIEFPDSPPFSG